MYIDTTNTRNPIRSTFSDNNQLGLHQSHTLLPYIQSNTYTDVQSASDLSFSTESQGHTKDQEDKDSQGH